MHECWWQACRVCLAGVHGLMLMRVPFHLADGVAVPVFISVGTLLTCGCGQHCLLRRCKNDCTVDTLSTLEHLGIYKPRLRQAARCVAVS